jgi:hypothetical protein
LFAEGQATYRQAQQQASTEHWQAARTSYQQAQEMFTAAMAAAHHEQARQAAVAAYESAQ